MSGFQEITSKDLKDFVSRPLLTFKFQKSLPNVSKTKLSAGIKTYFNKEKDDPDIKKKKCVFPLLENDDEVTKDEKTSQCNEEKLLYTEPPWTGVPTSGLFKLEVLRSGVIEDCFDLSFKSFYDVGNSESCDICLSHQTISRHHAILQYKSLSEFENEKSFYVYDLNSEYGTFVNGNRVESKKYIYLDDGYILTFGNHNDKYILKISKKINEIEAGMSIAELDGLQMAEETTLSKKTENEDEKSKGIDWGIGYDYEENSSSSDDVNFERTDLHQEQMFFRDPQKALKDWFKWEGYDLEYETEDTGFGRHSCSIDLILDPTGTTKRISVNIVGDKTKAIAECASKACQFLFNNGLLQAAHDEKQSTLQNWEQMDYYDSDDDNYLDRTGVIEKKRKHRMKMDGKTGIGDESSSSKVKEYSVVVEKIKKIEATLAAQKNNCEPGDDSGDELDNFMSKLNSTTTLNKTDIIDLKMKLRNLYKKKQQMLNSTIDNGSIE